MDQWDLTANIDVTRFDAVCYFKRLGQKIIQLTLPPPAKTSEAEVMFQVLGSLSFEERSDLMCFDLVQQPVQPLYLVKFVDMMGSNHYAFEVSQGALDDEVCPGCGCEMSAGLNPMCEHPIGCGSKRKLPDTTPYQEKNENIN